ncbi:DNA-binding LacI/PurR family transcriptional regulator [Rhizobium leguminosarum]|uniref:DNA-binding LacI/PurR family transcriptional regulator n=1 Tax=Rhizobium leguminosarum TaxID=384 RepID=A0AAE2T091_RHILE|nr:MULTISPECIES: LacI family DNA-binding transcriptional regulator [Rhizobium]MBB4293309.1 DNA-binding LacI/PurR family transcriptional regulator [Rhizobium leguminosarum]MBB4296080.1 DNA-binding LacI/PurR family transcriptional regulator [Rhizobium leguminosarum]MBB4311429.1 DNA-binding LacI/PurR family transcriptional regulator [Rhizobium leguminosarum]MBB4420305.1 DNA-binding LacI/PurR family transcriptional regulator [Rhizobium leguminosarum]MBB4435527.1 DNA-binding LacI/PurR family transc
MNDQKIRRPRQADIATLAGVSVSTVSRVLANEPGISETVRRQILKVAAEHGYPVKPASETVAGALALIASDGVTGGLSVFYEAIVDGLRAGAAEAGMPFEIRMVREDRTTPDAIRDYMQAAAADGLFLVGIDPNEMLRNWLQGNMTPTVLVNGTDPRMQFDGVSPANFFGAYEATTRLTQAGHRRILHLSGSHRHTIRERIRGFEAAIAAVPGAEGRFVPLALQGGASHEAHERTAAILAENAGFSAAFCMNDFIAVGVLEAVTEAGLRVPEDFAIVGFDDLPCALMTNPQLSTMRVDRAAIGREAVSLMLSRFRNRAVPARHICQAVIPVPGGTVPNAENRE